MYLITNYKWKGTEKYRYIHVCMQLNSCAIYLKSSQYCKSNILQFKKKWFILWDIFRPYTYPKGCLVVR